MPQATADSQPVHSFHAYTTNFVRFGLQVWKRDLNVTTAEGTKTVSGYVARTLDGHVAHPRGEGFFEIPALGVVALAERR